MSFCDSIVANYTLQSVTFLFIWIQQVMFIIFQLRHPVFVIKEKTELRRVQLEYITNWLDNLYKNYSTGNYWNEQSEIFCENIHEAGKSRKCDRKEKDYGTSGSTAMYILATDVPEALINGRPSIA